MLTRARRGQSTTEWMLLISVIVVGVVGAGYAFVSIFGPSMERLGEDAATIYTTGDLGP